MKKLLALLLAMLMVFSLTACNNGGGEEEAEKPGIYGFAVDSATDTLQSMIMQSGVGIWNNTTKTVEFDDEKVYEALDWYGKGVQEGVFLSNPSLSNYFSDDYNAKNIAMYVGSVAGAPYLKESWKTAPMPQTEGGIPWTPAWNRGMLVFDYGDEARIQGAARFIEYFATPEVNTAWCIACNYMTALKTTQEYEGYKTYLASEDPNVAALNALSPETAGAFDAVPAVQYVRNALTKKLLPCLVQLPKQSLRKIQATLILQLSRSGTLIQRLRRTLWKRRLLISTQCRMSTLSKSSARTEPDLTTPFTRQSWLETDRISSSTTLLQLQLMSSMARVLISASS